MFFSVCLFSLFVCLFSLFVCSVCLFVQFVCLFSLFVQFVCLFSLFVCSVCLSVQFATLFVFVQFVCLCVCFYLLKEITLSDAMMIHCVPAPFKFDLCQIVYIKQTMIENENKKSKGKCSLKKKYFTSNVHVTVTHLLRVPQTPIFFFYRIHHTYFFTVFTIHTYVFQIKRYDKV